MKHAFLAPRSYKCKGRQLVCRLHINMLEELELIYLYFPPSLHLRLFLSCRPFVVITTFSTGLVGVEVTSVSWFGQLTVGILVLNIVTNMANEQNRSILTNPNTIAH